MAKFVTLTLNPCLDYSVVSQDVASGAVNRLVEAEWCLGGKGINVSRTLMRLGCIAQTVVVTGGFVGKEIGRRMIEEGLDARIIETTQNSRVNVKMQDGTEFNASGSPLDAHAAQQLQSEIRALDKGSWLAIGGSVPPEYGGLPELMRIAAERGVRVAVDTSGEWLCRALSEKPFLVKPNEFELEEWAGIRLATLSDRLCAAERMSLDGAQNILVSLGAEGAFLCAADGMRYLAKAPEGKAVLTVGAGDASVAGFLYGYEKSKSYEEALRYAVAVGSTHVFSGGAFTLDDLQQRLAAICIERLPSEHKA